MEFYTNVQTYGDHILYRGYRDGLRVKDRVNFKPTLFLGVDEAQSPYMSLTDVPVKPNVFGSLNDAKEFVEMYSHTGKVYGNTRWVTNFIQNQFPDEIKFNRDMVNVASLDIEVHSDEGFPDPDRAEYPITVITVKNNHSDMFNVWGVKAFDPDQSIFAGKVAYTQYRSEEEMLQGFLDWWSDAQNMPDILTGWNSRFFDVPYIINRIARLLGEKTYTKLSPWPTIKGCIRQKNVTIMGQTKLSYEIVGISQLDYLDLFRKFTLNTYGNQESYKLGHIAHIVLNETKLSYAEYGSLGGLYKNNFQKYVDYNIKDVELLERLEDKLGLITLVLTLSYIGGVNYTDTLGTTAIWESIIYRDLMSRKIIPTVTPIRPSYEYTIIGSKTEEEKALIEEGDEPGSFAGGYVKDPKVGFHDWVCSFDLNSLYPNLIIQYNMSPETILPVQTQGVHPDKLLAGNIPQPEIENAIVASNGVLFDPNRKGIIPEIIKGIYDKRVVLKKDMIAEKKKLEKIDKSDKVARFKVEREISRLENHQVALKILLNSLYGALGNKHFHYFDVRVAEGTTLSGQTAIRWAEMSVNKYLNGILKTKDVDYVIAIDTDSVYVTMKPIVDMFKPNNPVKFLDEFCAKAIEPVFKDAYEKLAKNVGCPDNRMIMKREAIADRGIWTAKKRYILNVHNNEGVQYAEPKIKVMGIEAVKSSTPEICRDEMKRMFKIILTKTEAEAQTEIKDFRDKFKTLDPVNIAFPRGTKDISSYRSSNTIYKKGSGGTTPIHVRGCLLFNHHLKMKNLLNKYETIKNGEKIKFIYLRTPNAINENVISFIDVIPKEFNLHNHIDFDKQFEKTYLDPIKIIFEAIGWKCEETSSLESFFS